MSHRASHLLSLFLLGTGAAAWAWSAAGLATEPALRFPTNPLGMKRSPYGEVLAMAMQTPINRYWETGVEDHEGHHHGPGETCTEGDDHDHPEPSSAHQGWFDELNAAANLRTNQKAAPPALKFWVRRQIEDQLRFAYELDPSHYGNYCAYLFFLAEPSLGTRPELTPQALALTEDTIRYSLARKDDPRPALTAAAAAQNGLGLMFAQPAKYSIPNMRRLLDTLDQSLARHRELRDAWIATGQWNALSQQRRDEAAERYQFLEKLRLAAAATIDRLARERPMKIE
ncbi:MAG TPA: hypothetical protein VIM46_00745 [Luteolibacter sp.]